jgi:hypothetical protein
MIGSSRSNEVHRNRRQDVFISVRHSARRIDLIPFGTITFNDWEATTKEGHGWINFAFEDPPGIAELIGPTEAASARMPHFLLQDQSRREMG